MCLNALQNQALTTLFHNRFTDGLKRREKEDEKTVVIEGKTVKDIDDLLEIAQFSPNQQAGKQKKKHGHRKRGASILRPGKKAHCSDSNLRSLDITSRLDEWYEKASAEALQTNGNTHDDSLESFSGSESEEIYDHAHKMRKNKSLGDCNLETEIFNSEELGNKWMSEKKLRLTVEERGRSGSDSSYEPVSTDETEPSTESVAKDDIASLDRERKVNANTITSIIISQASIDLSADDVKLTDASSANLPNQPIFYIPNFSEDKANPTIIGNAKEKPRADRLQAAETTRPRSRSAIGPGDVYERKKSDDGQEMLRKSKSLVVERKGIARRGSVDTADPPDRKERLLRCSSEHRKKNRPHSLHLSPDLRHTANRMDHTTTIPFNVDMSRQTDTNPVLYKNDKKQDKQSKLSKLPGNSEFSISSSDFSSVYLSDCV